MGELAQAHHERKIIKAKLTAVSLTANDQAA
jgi:hypothetical protein